MTLVVAHLFPDGPRIVCDSKLTDVRGITRGYLKGALKAVILDRGLCVCFAGWADLGQNAILQLGIKPGVDYEMSRVEQHLLEAHLSSREETDFIIATLDPPSLSKISSGSIATHQQRCWIGDFTAYEVFQKCRFSVPDVSVSSDDVPDVGTRSTTNEFSKMFQAMMQVIFDPHIPSVDEVLVSVIVEGFAFGYSTMALVRPGRAQAIPSGVGTTLRFGTAEEGAFAYAVLTPQEPGIGALGVHFYQARLGALFYPAKFPDPEVYRDVSHDEFRSQVNHRHGIEIQGVMIS